MADVNQIERLRKYVRCKKHIKGEVVKCNRAFLNFNLDMIDDIEAEEYYFVSHANYEELHRVHGGYIPPIDNPKLTHYIGVSQFSTDKLNEYAEYIKSPIRAKKCYNPLTLEPKEKVIHLVTACRLDDKVKGGGRTLKLIEALDRYCENIGRHYILHIFTNKRNRVEIKSKNVVYMEPRTDVRPYIADADYVLQLSNDMETYCYTINEALGYGVPIVTTPLSILKELPITDNEHLVLEWNCNNVDEIAKQIFEKEVKPFKYIPPEDEWNKLLVEGKSTYEEEKKMKYLVQATNKYIEKHKFDEELSKIKGVKYYPKEGEQWEVDYKRMCLLTGDNKFKTKFVTVIKEINEEVEETIENEEIIKEETTEEKPKRKPRKVKDETKKS